MLKQNINLPVSTTFFHSANLTKNFDRNSTVIPRGALIKTEQALNKPDAYFYNTADVNVVWAELWLLKLIFFIRQIWNRSGRCKLNSRKYLVKHEFMGKARSIPFTMAYC